MISELQCWPEVRFTEAPGWSPDWALQCTIFHWSISEIVSQHFLIDWVGDLALKIAWFGSLDNQILLNCFKNNTFWLKWSRFSLGRRRIRLCLHPSDSGSHRMVSGSSRSRVRNRHFRIWIRSSLLRSAHESLHSKVLNDANVSRKSGWNKSLFTQARR